MVDVLAEIMEDVGNPIDPTSIQMVGWARAYEDTTTMPGYVLLGAAFTEERKDQLKWVGPVYPLQLALIGKQNRNIVVETASDASKYVVGTLLNSAPEQLLFKQGFPPDKVYRIPKTEFGLRMLADGRLDLLAYAAIPSFHMMEELGIDPTMYQVYYVIKEVDLYFGFNKSFDDQFISKLNTALEKLKIPDENGTSEYDRILKKYLK
ncbi:amino acid ABC transporter substrate-binding protein [Pseudodesulfovibrio sediminis]|uniref:Amino acid ABC transporter substrate-binding protein n=2 Tax=Pseudodesulfovibrio sediminis TaxID=2810563 RepID=A0ABM7P3A3_9BACT|nr:amino acid ABC transporter substrate-binding protein [Pseudodesulfovibrio sediminis]